MNGGAMVTGAAGMIGRAIVRRLVRDGITVAAVDRQDSSTTFAGEDKVVPVVADLSTADGRAAAVDQARAAVGAIRYLVNDAADCRAVPLLESTDDEWREVLEVNLITPAALTRLAFDDLRATGGVVVNMSSVRGVASLPGGASYEASKGGLLALTRAMAGELGHHGVRAVSICPGAITDDPEHWLDESDPDFKAAWNAAHPMGLAGHADAVADVVGFVCSDNARHVNGIEIVVDGGVIAQYAAAGALRARNVLPLP